MGKRTEATPEEFVKTWQAADSLAEVAEKLGLTRHSASNRGMRYRNAGVKLKKFERGRNPIDVDALNKLCK